MRGRAPFAHTVAHVAHDSCVFSSHFQHCSAGRPLALPAGVIWFFEKDTDLLVCEIRRAADDESRYEFEIADAEGPKTRRFDSPTELISNYLSEQTRLIKAGWRPRADLQVVD